MTYSRSPKCRVPSSFQKKKTHQSFNEKYGWESCSFQLAQSNLISSRWKYDEEFHNAADKLQLLRHVKQT
jgi:hypothetical protein